MVRSNCIVGVSVVIRKSGKLKMQGLLRVPFIGLLLVFTSHELWETINQKRVWISCYDHFFSSRLSCRKKCICLSNIVWPLFLFFFDFDRLSLTTLILNWKYCGRNRKWDPSRVLVKRMQTLESLTKQYRAKKKKSLKTWNILRGKYNLSFLIQTVMHFGP